MASSDPESVVYWREKAEELEEKLTASQLEFDEYQENSGALEAELEAQIQQDEKKLSELQTRNVRAEQDNFKLQGKIDHVSRESQLRIQRLEEDVRLLSEQCHALQGYTRELEQTNDDLDRAQRATVQSLSDFEARLNDALERNALLEGELDEKEALAVMVQRLKDESRDLRQEMSVSGRLGSVRNSSPRVCSAAAALSEADPSSRSALGVGASPSLHRHMHSATTTRVNASPLVRTASAGASRVEYITQNGGFGSANSKVFASSSSSDTNLQIQIPAHASSSSKHSAGEGTENHRSLSPARGPLFAERQGSCSASIAEEASLHSPLTPPTAQPPFSYGSVGVCASTSLELPYSRTGSPERLCSKSKRRRPDSKSRCSSCLTFLCCLQCWKASDSSYEELAGGADSE